MKVKRMTQSTSAVVVFDADNTLWDTNAVFRHAQLSLLRVFAKANSFHDEDKELAVLRRVDRELINQLGRFEYDFHILATAIAYYYYKNLSVEDSVSQAISDTTSQFNSELSLIIDEAHLIFEKELKQIPALFPDTETILSSIHSCKSHKHSIAVLIFSDGSHSRLERILQAYGIRERGLFDEIIIGAKSVESFCKAKMAGLKYLGDEADPERTLFVMIGDSLQRDIKPANKAGYITVYKPANFLGQEIPSEKDEKPCYTITTLNELTPILKKIGLPLCFHTSNTEIQQRA